MGKPLLQNPILILMFECVMSFVYFQGCMCVCVFKQQPLIQMLLAYCKLKV